MRLSLPKLFALSALALAPACGGSDSDGNSPRVGLLVGDAPTDTLSSFTLTITEFRLIREQIQVTENLLAAPRTVEVLGLGMGGQEALLDFTEFESGRYNAAILTIDPDSVLARDLDGVEVPVNVLDASDGATFASTRNGDLFLGRGGFASVSIEIVLDQSLEANGPGFDFTLTTRAAHTTATPFLEDFTGQVVSIDRPGKQFTAEVVDARRPTADFGDVIVEVSDSDSLFQFTGAEFGNSNAFLAALKVNDYVQIGGAFARSGIFDARRCEIEDRHDNQVRIEGRVQATDLPGQTVEVLWEEIEKGYAHAFPVLDALGMPGVISVSWDNQTAWLGSRGGGGPGEPEDLVPGKRVEILFDNADFAAPMPFLARNIRVDLAERYEGVITDVAGLPDDFEVTLDNDHPAVTSGRITGPVTVELDGDTVVFLDTGVTPWLEPGDLLTGLKVEMTGKLLGSMASATLPADRVEVQPGRLEAVVDSVSPTERRLTFVITDRKDPFGDPEPAMTADAIFPTEAILEADGGLIDFEGVRALFDGLGANQTLTIDLEGIGDGTGNVLVYDADFDVEDE